MTEAAVPPVVYLPCSPASTDAEPLVEKRTLEDGDIALLAFTALDRLLDGCGPHQPWILYPTSALGDLKPYAMIVLDGEIPDDARHGGIRG